MILAYDQADHEDLRDRERSAELDRELRRGLG